MSLFAVLGGGRRVHLLERRPAETIGAAEAVGIDILALPPAAPEGLEQRRGVAVAGGLGPHPADNRVLVGLLRGQQVQVAHRAQAVLGLGQVQALARGGLGQHLLLQGLGVGLQGTQGIGYVLEGGDHRAAIARCGLVIGGHRGALAMLQGAGVEQRLGDGAGQAPDPGAGGKQFGARQRRGAQGTGNAELRQLVGDGHADIGAGLMQLGLGGTHVGPLLDDGRRQAQGQFLGQVQGGQLEVFATVLAGEAT